MHHLMYYNFSLLRLFGGTSDLLSGLYLRTMLNRYVPGRIRVSFPKPLIPRLMLKELEKGRILYVQVIRHPKYRNHHFLCYGAERTDGYEADRFRFVCADGWGMKPEILYAEDFGAGSFRSISLL